MIKLKLIFNGLCEAIEEDTLWWFTSFVLAVFQPLITANIKHQTMSVLGISDNFVLYLVPTILGCLVAVFYSKAPTKKKWGVVSSSLLFNGYILESIYAFFGYSPNSLGYFLGGLSAFWVMGFFMSFLMELNEKGLPMVWATIKRLLDEVKIKVLHIPTKKDEPKPKPKPKRKQ